MEIVRIRRGKENKMEWHVHGRYMGEFYIYK